MSQHLDFKFTRTAPSQPLGLGDLVAKVAQPIAKAIDTVAGTKLATCPPCSQRQAKLNALMPNVSKPLGSGKD